MKPRKAWIFTATSPSQILGGYDAIKPETDLLVAVDAGLTRLHELGLTPSIIIGDMDSAEPELLKQYPPDLTQLFPTKKNETDTELALLWGIEAGADEFIIVNGLEGRFDHSLALIHNLDFLHAKGLPARIESAFQRVWFLSGDAKISGCRGCTLSLMPWCETVKFQGSKGLAYPLQGISLHPGQTRGLSNIIEEDEAFIGLDSGQILAILTKKVP
ncbi:MAG: thiamine diphosphokinase [Candidatus Cloacimonadaceae bacterium]|jgi:thiamine pyrophosphokinase|nr:thiamine diphosphokinase [Candidatus Cloacimonadota bacterium]MDX9949330.1 thiamine diphosphokinase [Candidatus Syntrophosphaera sp.]NLN85197.1 thiamine diphosphokinase [Candidatus Cloacimonadota bacterium]